MATTERTNTPCGNVPSLSNELEDKILAWLPPRVRHWLQYDAPYNHDLGSVFRMLRAGHSADSVLRALRTGQRVDTAQVYGQSHPQAAYSTAAR
jgi:hypothetical protein